MQDTIVIQSVCSILFFVGAVWGMFIYANSGGNPQLPENKRPASFKSKKTNQEKRWEENAR